jgi:hypothetical protein
LAIGVALSVMRGSAASAQAPAQDQAAARVLFDEARELARAGNFAAACPKFEAASRLFPSPGSLLNLGDCQEKRGLTASAWSHFGEAASVADRVGREDVKREAKRRQKELEPRLMRLAIQVASPPAGLVVRRDGVAIAPAAWGMALPVDPGAHVVRAEAPGREPWELSVELTRAGQSERVEVPELVREPAPFADASTSAAPARDVAGAGPVRSSTSHVLEWSLIGGGAALAAGGGVLMLIESGRASASREDNDPAAYDATKTPWAIGLGGLIAGSAAAAVGVAWLLGSSSEPAAAHEAGGEANDRGGALRGWSPSGWIVAGGAGMSLGGRW